MDLKNDKPSIEEGQAFLPSSRNSEEDAPRLLLERPKRGLLWYLRLLLEFGMAVTIVVFIAAKPYCGRGTIRRSPVPQFPRKIWTFQNSTRYVTGNMFFNRTETLHTLHHWIELSSAARGFVVIKNPEKYDLPEPLTIAVDRFHDGPGYMMTVFHQLHCLSYVAEHLQQGYDGVNLTHEVAHHTAHCVNYLLQGIMCSADTTLEGKTEAGPGEGSEHECVDYEALLNWSDDHGAMRWRTFLPEEATLG
ncbi:hypothetical protein AA313_de0205100 [Arthrobotrys entomopaga]|nr:hypothetical protein AA313_de0205100 [Arthrobotrys entomopaga]